jgi:hypothetical protein
MQDQRIQRPGMELTNTIRRWLRQGGGGATGGSFGAGGLALASSAVGSAVSRVPLSLSFLITPMTSGLIRSAPEAKPLVMILDIFIQPPVS